MKKFLLAGAVLTFSILATAQAQVIDKNSGCDACASNEWAVYTNEFVPHGLYAYEDNPDCIVKSSTAEEVSKLAAALLLAYGEQYSSSLEMLVKLDEGKKFLSDHVRGEIGKHLNGGDSKASSCRAICLVVPKDAEVQRVRNQAREATPKDVPIAQNQGTYDTCGGNEGGKCLTLGVSAWEQPVRTEDRRLVCNVFKNWSDNKGRVARLIVYFTMPPGQTPIGK